MVTTSDRRNQSALSLVAAAIMMVVVCGCSTSTPGTAVPLTPEPETKQGTLELISPLLASDPGQAETKPEHKEEKVNGKPGSVPVKSPIGIAVLQLAQRLGANTESIVIVRIDEGLRVPAHASICADPVDEASSPRDVELVEVSELVLAASGREYTFRVKGWEVALCQPASAFSDTSGLPELGRTAQPVALAVRELATARDIPAGKIVVLSVEAVDWPDSSLGCPEEGMMYAQVLTPGYRIVLEAEGSAAVYHSGPERVILCQDDLGD